MIRIRTHHDQNSITLVDCRDVLKKWDCVRLEIAEASGAIVVRAEEALIVIFMLVLWMAALSLFFIH